METALQTRNLTKALTVLKQYFGFDSFRSLQQDIITDLLAGQDLLVLMPTGGGKSLCYQIPALVREGIAIVVSPLIALMEDQVAALKAQGVRAAYYNSSLSTEEAKQVLAQLHQQELDLLYIAPERLVNPAFLERLQDCPLALFAIDEAHCISQWGHDFRPEYAALGLLKNHFPHVPVIALTATADQQTRKDIILRLNYQPKCYIASFNRPNIYYQVMIKNNPMRQLTQFLSNQNNHAGIIYCGTRSSVERLAEKLQLQNFRARAYHAGLSHQERREVQTLFRYDQIDIVVATLAFGMGIDKPNVRFVVHYDLPKNIEGYYQETGRAGRDGLPALALLLYDPGDSARLRSFISTMTDEVRERVETAKLNHIIAFAQATHCRRQILLNYFAEESLNACGQCDICDNPPQTHDATEDAQKFLSCVYRLRQSYGMLYVIDVLRGSNTDKILQARHHQLTTFAIGNDKPATYWRHLAWQLIHKGYCYQDADQFNVLKLDKKAIPLLKGEEKIALTLPPPEKKTDKAAKKSLTRVVESSNPALFEKLRSLRRQLADTENKPSFMIFSDTTLHDMVRRNPKTLADMLEVSGIGQHKLAHYGLQFLEVLGEG